jgi:hypothetical protein
MAIRFNPLTGFYEKVYPIASQADAIAGTSNDKMMTPLATAEAIAALAGGFIKDPQGNVYVTPNLRYTPTDPPQEQTLQNGAWVTVRTVQ